MVRKALIAHDFDLAAASAQREFVMEQKAMYYIASDWEAELLTKAIPRSEIAGLKRKLNPWTVCMMRCIQLSNEIGEQKGVKWTEQVSESSNVGVGYGQITCIDTVGPPTDSCSDVEIVDKLTTEQKHVMNSIILGDGEYEDAVVEARTKIRAAIETFSGAKLDDSAVRRRLMEEVHHLLRRGGNTPMRSRDEPN